MAALSEEARSSSRDIEELSSHLEDSLVQEALKSGEDLRTYSEKIEQQLKSVEHAAVADYIKQAEPLAQLHQEISSCDKVLEQMESLLVSFEDDLGTISTDIQRLQEQSVLMNQRLKNRQATRGELSQFVDDMVIPHQMIQSIVERPASDREFLEQLHELQHKIQFIKAQEFRDARSAYDVQAVIENLRLKSVEKIREYLLARVYQFRKPLANYQIPQTALLKHRFFYEFLLGNEREVAREVRDEYVDTLSKMFFSYFKTYTSRLLKLQVRNRATVFSLGQRIAVLTTDLEAPLIVPHVAQQNNQRFQFECLFRSAQLAVVDHATHEYLFLTDFFMLADQSLVDMFGTIMGKSIATVTKCIEDKVNLNFDAISLLLCCHICGKYSDIMKNRGVDVLDGYWRNLRGVLWSRFETIMHFHIESLRTADVRKYGAIDTRPHYIVRRYAEFTLALLVIVQQAEVGVDEHLQALITRLQAEMEQLLGKFAREVGGVKKQQLICLINNYDLILTVLSERLTEDTKETESFKELLQMNIDRYIEEVLFPHFGALIGFVNECEPLIDQSHTELLKRYAEKVPNIVRSFGAEWKRSVESINQEVMSSFTNFKNGTNILQGTLTQLIQYYHRFQKVLGHPAFSACAAKNDLVNIHHIMVELKKYKPAF